MPTPITTKSMNLIQAAWEWTIPVSGVHVDTLQVQSPQEHVTDEDGHDIAAIAVVPNPEWHSSAPTGMLGLKSVDEIADHPCLIAITQEGQSLRVTLPEAYDEQGKTVALDSIEDGHALMKAVRVKEIEWRMVRGEVAAMTALTAELESEGAKVAVDKRDSEEIEVKSENQPVVNAVIMVAQLAATMLTKQREIRAEAATPLVKGRSPVVGISYEMDDQGRYTGKAGMRVDSGPVVPIYAGSLDALNTDRNREREADFGR